MNVTEDRLFGINAMFNDEIAEIQKGLLLLEQSTGTRPAQRSKRAVLTFGSKILKFLYGTPDADDAIDYNEKFKELYNNQQKQEELNAHNFKAVSSLFTVTEKTAQRFASLDTQLGFILHYATNSLNIDLLQKTFTHLCNLVKDNINAFEMLFFSHIKMFYIHE